MFENEKECLKQVSTGDREAYKRLFDYYYPKVNVFLVKLLHDTDVSEDISQDIFVRIWLMRNILTEINSFGAYLYKMTRNSALSYLRKKKCDTTPIESLDVAEDYAIDEAYIAKEKQYRIEQIVNQMPIRRRKVFVLSRMEGLSNSEIAEKLNISTKTVENHLNLALREIRQTLSILAFFI
jgi:RNA polymerase sigma-70 factor (ECF subfamily)